MGMFPLKRSFLRTIARASEAALIASMAEMVINGVATRRGTQIMETLCDTSCSKSTVSEVCKDLDAKVKEFRERPLTGNYPLAASRLI